MSDRPPAQPGAEPVRKAEFYAATRDWPGYFRAVLGKPPRDTLLAALGAFESEGPPGLAVDLACGEGRDTLELLRRGWRVIAIDPEGSAFELLRQRVAAPDAARLLATQATFQTSRWPDGVDLVNCSFSLPFCEPPDFPGLWARIATSLRTGGRFAGQFFGDRDSWASLPDRSHHTRGEVLGLLQAFDIEMLQEEERESDDARGVAKHWHVFHVVARKR
jgi:SAM-dependent methyltransferase